MTLLGVVEDKHMYWKSPAFMSVNQLDQISVKTLNRKADTSIQFIPVLPGAHCFASDSYQWTA